MEVTELDNYYLKHKEPFQGCLLALKGIITGISKDIIHVRKYKIPFFYYKDWKIAFLWVYRKKIMVGIIVDKRIYPLVPGVKRKDVVKTILVAPDEDIPIYKITTQIKENIELYDSLKFNI